MEHHVSGSRNGRGADMYQHTEATTTKQTRFNLEQDHNGTNRMSTFGR